MKKRHHARAHSRSGEQSLLGKPFLKNPKNSQQQEEMTSAKPCLQLVWQSPCNCAYLQKELQTSLSSYLPEWQLNVNRPSETQMPQCKVLFETFCILLHLL